MTIPIDEAAFNRLVSTLKPGSFTVMATDNGVTIKGVYVDYLWTSANNFSGMKAHG